VKGSDPERFEELYRRIWAVLNRPASAGLSHHQRQVLHHLTAEPVALSWLASHLGLPSSTTSVLVKRLASRGLVSRARDPGDERRLAITLTDACPRPRWRARCARSARPPGPGCWKDSRRSPAPLSPRQPPPGRTTARQAHRGQRPGGLTGAGPRAASASDALAALPRGTDARCRGRGPVLRGGI
jgi:hypothetical protein